MTPQFQQTTQGAIATLTIRNPARRNAVTDAMWAGLPNILSDLKNNPDTRTLIVTGDGAHFSAGADISEFDRLYRDDETAHQTGKTLGAALQALADFPKPVIAKVKGNCFGGGYAIALACDVRLADETAKLGITPAKLGLTYPAADLERLVATIGLANAKDLVLSARTVNAREAMQLGLINRVYASGDIDGAVQNYAEKTAALSPYSHGAMKAGFADITHGRAAKDADFNAKDFAQGYAAFKAKRPPVF